jgi:hypothetical protein
VVYEALAGSELKLDSDFIPDDFIPFMEEERRTGPTSSATIIFEDHQ